MQLLNFLQVRLQYQKGDYKIKIGIYLINLALVLILLIDVQNSRLGFSLVLV